MFVTSYHKLPIHYSLHSVKIFRITVLKVTGTCVYLEITVTRFILSKSSV